MTKNKKKGARDDKQDLKGYVSAEEILECNAYFADVRTGERHWRVKKSGLWNRRPEVTVELYRVHPDNHDVRGLASKPRHYSPPMNVYSDIPYTSAPVTPHPLRTFDLFSPFQNSLSSKPAPLICLVHGGAWRS
jgi:hypothetical protein